MSSYIKQDLIDLIKDMMGLEKITPSIANQINRFILDYGMSFKEIARCLVYWVEVKGQALQPQFGIGIVPNIREEAEQYFHKLELEKEAVKIEAKKAVECEGNNIIINIKPAVKQDRKVPQLDLDEIDLGDNNDGSSR